MQQIIASMSWSSMPSFSSMDLGPVNRSIAWTDSTLPSSRFVASSSPTLGVVEVAEGRVRRSDALKAGWSANAGQVVVKSPRIILLIILSENVGEIARMYELTSARRRVSSTSIARPFETRGSWKKVSPLCLTKGVLTYQSNCSTMAHVHLLRASCSAEFRCINCSCRSADHNYILAMIAGRIFELSRMYDFVFEESYFLKQLGHNSFALRASAQD